MITDSINRFGRDYELTISALTHDIVIKPPMRIAFDAFKSIAGGLNKMTLKAYNLSETTRLAIVKDADDVDERIPITLKVGYEGALQSVFKGTIHVGKNAREGVDMVSDFQCLDGGFDFLNSYSNRVSTVSPCNELLLDMPNTKKGKIRTTPPLARPKVLVGNTAWLLDEAVGPDETWFIDDEQLFVIKHNQVTSAYLPVVSAATGLLGTPTREAKKVTFQTLMNPALKIGGQCALASVTAPHLSGTYRIETINYSGDYNGANWSQTVSGYLGLFLPVI